MIGSGSGKGWRFSQPWKRAVRGLLGAGRAGGRGLAAWAAGVSEPLGAAASGGPQRCREWRAVAGTTRDNRLRPAVLFLPSAKPRLLSQILCRRTPLLPLSPLAGGAIAQVARPPSPTSCPPAHQRELSPSRPDAPLWAASSDDAARPTGAA